MPKKTRASTTKKGAAQPSDQRPVLAPRASPQVQARQLSDLSLFLHAFEELDPDNPMLFVRARELFGLPAGMNRAQLISQLHDLKRSLEMDVRGRFAALPEHRDQVMVYQIKITLEHLSPPVWRRVLVKSDTTLETLHEIIQAVMPWDGGHLHEFEINHLRYGSQDEEFGVDADYDEGDTRLFEVLGRVKAKGRYEYDFGDSWRHEVLIEKVLGLDSQVVYPVCIDGRRACPPDDCGGAWGYAELLEAIQNPNHPEREERLDWFGGVFDPEVFDLEEANEGLAFLRAERR